MASLLLFLLPLLLLRSSAAQDATTVWDILEQHGLPRGLVPGSVTGYSLADDGSFVVRLAKPCYVQFDYLVHYDATVTGTIAYGSIKNVRGIQAKALLFLWLDVTGISADSTGAKVEFQIGSISKTFPAKQFEDVPSCQKSAGAGLLGGVAPSGGRLFQQLLLPDV